MTLYIRPIFHGPLTSDFGQIIKVKILVQGRILSSTNGRWGGARGQYVKHHRFCLLS